MNLEPNYFAKWLSDIDRPEVLLSEIREDDMDWDYITNEDLLAILYFGDQTQSIKALRALQGRFEEELNALNEQLSHQGDWL